MSFSFDKSVTDNFTSEDFALLKLVEEISEIEEEIKLKKKSIDNRVDLVKRIIRNRGKGGNLHEMIENKELHTAIESYLLKIEGENKIMLGYEEKKEKKEEKEEKEEKEKKNNNDEEAKE